MPQIQLQLSRQEAETLEFHLNRLAHSLHPDFSRSLGMENVTNVDYAQVCQIRAQLQQQIKHN